MNYGYARISSSSQNIDRQIRNIRCMCPNPNLKMIVEVYTGRTQERPEWKKYYSKFQAGDSIYFDSVSRMSRTEDEGVREYLNLYERGVNLFFNVEPQINTDVYREACQPKIPMTGTDVDVILEAVKEYMKRVAEHQVRIAFQQAEKEVIDLSRRTKEGIQTARINGKVLGRPKGIHYPTEKEIKAKKKMLQRAKCFGGDLSDSDCMKIVGISRGTYYRYKNELLDMQDISKAL